MALNFPDSPTLNQVYTDATSGFSYKWNGTVWTSFESSTASNIQELDDISGSFNGVTTTFALTVGGQSITPVTTNQLVISVGGVMQNPTNDFYISGSNIVFTTAPASGLTFFGTLLGTALSLNTIADGSVTPLKLSTGGPSWNTGGDVVITGTGTTALLVNGNARVTGILTVGSSSITLNGSTDQINVGTGLTLSSTGIVAGIATINTELDIGIGGTVLTAFSSTGRIGLGTGTPASKLDLFGASTQSVVAIAASDINCSLGNYFIDTVNGNKTYTVSGVATDRAYSFTLEVTHTTGTITWFSNLEWPGGTAPTLTTGKTHLFMFLTDNGGSRWRGSSLVNYTN